MPRLALFIVAVLLLPSFAQAQPSSAPEVEKKPLAQNGIYLEIGGNGLLYSLNYDRRFSEHVSGRVGLMIFEGQSEQATDDRLGVAIVPVMANYLAGGGSHRLELGGGLLLGAAGADTEEYGNISGAGLTGVTTTFGYRYQPRGGGFTFRAGLTPFYSGRPQLWGGLSLGYSF